MSKETREPTSAKLRNALKEYLRGEAAIDDPLFARVGGRIQQQGFVAPDDIYLILLWKSVPSEALKLARRALLENPSDEIENTSRKALSFVQQDSSSDAAIKAIRALTEIRHLGIPIASAILTLYDPTRFGAMTARSCKALGWPDNRSKWKPEDYGPYLLRIREIAETSGLTPREVDAALEQLGRT
jgi:hypothetical protein